MGDAGFLSGKSFPEAAELHAHCMGAHRGVWLIWEYSGLCWAQFYLHGYESIPPFHSVVFVLFLLFADKALDKNK